MSCNQYKGDPSADSISEVRFLLPDNEEPFLFTSKEVQYLLDNNNDDPLSAAIAGADIVAGRFAGCVDKSIGKVRISYSQKYKQWKERSKDLQCMKENAEGVEFFIGGTGKENACEVPLHPVFELGKDDHKSTYYENNRDNGRGKKHLDPDK